MHPNTVKRVKSLAKDTSRGLSHASRSSVDLAKHLISKKSFRMLCWGYLRLTPSKNNLVNLARMWWHLLHHSAANFRKSRDCKDKAFVKFRCEYKC